MKVSILGCGWLGFPLAKKLIEIGFEVKGSTTTENKLAVLKSNKIAPYLLEVSEHKISECISDFLYNADILIIDIPPGLRKIIEATSEKTFVAKIEKLIPFIENSTVKKSFLLVLLQYMLTLLLFQPLQKKVFCTRIQKAENNWWKLKICYEIILIFKPQ